MVFLWFAFVLNNFIAFKIIPTVYIEKVQKSHFLMKRVKNNGCKWFYFCSQFEFSQVDEQANTLVL